MINNMSRMLAEQREQISTESPACQAYRAAMNAAERKLARKMIDDPNVDDLEYSYTMHVHTYEAVKGLIKIQIAEHEEGKSWPTNK